MKAARYDTTVERGGAWERILRRANLDETVTVTDPCVMDVFTESPITAERGDPLYSITGVISSDSLSVTFTMTSTFTKTLTPGRYEYRLSMGDPILGDTIILLRGYMSVMDGVRS